LSEAVYDELRRLAASYLRTERSGHTLQPTALVHEAYLRLRDDRAFAAHNRSQFLAVAAVEMRRVLVDHARARGRAKRGGNEVFVTLDDTRTPAPERSLEVLALEEALEALEGVDPRAARIVELRFFSGLTIEETAEAAALSTATVEREWKLARAWLRQRMTGGE
jgi:RNA polymerase sigma factor (TIGR02999 family)